MPDTPGSVCLLPVPMRRLHKILDGEAFSSSLSTGGLCVCSRITSPVPALLLPHQRQDSLRFGVVASCRKQGKCCLLFDSLRGGTGQRSCLTGSTLPGGCVSDSSSSQMYFSVPSPVPDLILQWLEGFSWSQLFLAPLVSVVMSRVTYMLFHSCLSRLKGYLFYNLFFKSSSSLSACYQAGAGVYLLLVTREAVTRGRDFTTDSIC